jgi:hypothetical protein
MEDVTTMIPKVSPPPPLLLQRLHRSLQTTTHPKDATNQHKITVAQCLRSKSIPSLEVRRLLSQRDPKSSTTVSMSEIQISYEYIVTYYLPHLQQHHHHNNIIGCNDDTKDNNHHHHHLVTRMEQILSLGRFMELLLEYPTLERSAPAMPQPPPESPTTMASISCSTMIVSLIRALTDIAVMMMTVPSNNNCTTPIIRRIDPEYCYHHFNCNSSSFYNCDDDNNNNNNNEDDTADITTTKDCHDDTTNGSLHRLRRRDCHHRIPDTERHDRHYSNMVCCTLIFGTLLRYDYYCQHGHPCLLSTLWKSITTIVTAASTMTKTTTTTMDVDDDGAMVPTRILLLLPNVLWQSATQMILHHLYDGLHPIVQSTLDNILLAPPPPPQQQQQQPPPSEDHHPKEESMRLVYKIIGFLVTRFTPFWTFLSSSPSDVTATTTRTTRKSGTQSINHSSKRVGYQKEAPGDYGKDDDDDDEEAVDTEKDHQWNETYQESIHILLELRGMILLRSSEHVVHHNPAAGSVASSGSNSSNIYATVGTKIDQCMLTTPFSKTSRNEQQQHVLYIARRISDIIMYTADVRSIVNSPLFQPLASSSNNNPMDTTNTTKRTTIMSNQLLETAFYTGKTQILTQYLEDSMTSTSGTTTTCSGPWKDRPDPQDDRTTAFFRSRIESIVSTIEDLLFRTVPNMILLQSHSMIRSPNIRQHSTDTSNNSSRTTSNEMILTPPQQHTLQIISDALMQVEDWMDTDTKNKSTTNPNPPQHLDDNFAVSTTIPITVDRFYRLLIHWLSRCTIADDDDDDANHPHARLTSELIVTLLCRHITMSVEKFVAHDAMKRMGTSSSIRHPFLTLIVHLLWDSRTNIVLRTNIASVLIRLLFMSSQKVIHGDKTIQSNIGTIVGCELLSSTSSYLQQLQQMWMKMEQNKGGTITKKRKRCESNSTTSYRLIQPHQCTAKEFNIILSVLYVLPPGTSMNEVPFFQKRWIHLTTTVPTTNPNRPLSNKDMRLVTLCTSFWHCWNKNTTCKIDFPNIVQPLLLIWKHQRQRESGNIPNENLVLWTITVLRQVQYVCTKRNKNDVNPSRKNGIESTIHLLAICTDATILKMLESTSRLGAPKLGEHRGMDDRTSLKGLLVAMILEAIGALGWMGNSFHSASTLESSSSPSKQQLVLSISQCFNNLFSSSYWPIHVYTMTSFVQFASTVPSKYKSILPQCVPGNMQKLLQCRLQNSIYDGDSSFIQTERDLTKWKTKCMDAYVASHSRPPLTSRPTRNVPLFPSKVQSYTIPIGSYCMTMPTQEGRKALVIFPPGNDSLQDIRSMLGLDDGDDTGPSCHATTQEWIDENNVQQIRHDIVLSCGGVERR